MPLPLLWDEELLLLRKPTETELNKGELVRALEKNRISAPSMTEEIRKYVKVVETTNGCWKIDSDGKTQWDFEKFRTLVEKHESYIRTLLFAASESVLNWDFVLPPLNDRNTFADTCLNVHITENMLNLKTLFGDLPKMQTLHGFSLIMEDRQGFDLDNFLLVGEILRSINQTTDTRIHVLLLSGIIELIIGRQPNPARYHIDDSLQKQFITKGAVLIERYVSKKRYFNESTYVYAPLEEIGIPENTDKNIAKQKKDANQEMITSPSCPQILWKLYDLRSAIAHGNTKKIRDYERDTTWSGLFQLYPYAIQYARIIVYSLIMEPGYVKFLKDN